MTVRRAIAEDAERIAVLLHDIARQHAEGNPDVFDASGAKYGPEEVKKLIFDDNVEIFSADDGGYVVGYLICMVNVTKGEGHKKYRRVLYIDDLCVDESYRSRGVGKALFMKAKELAAELSCSAIDLNVWSFNRSAILFYEKMGMTESRRHMELKI